MTAVQESYAVLSSEEERRLYDWSLARSEKPDRYVWPFEVDITQTPTEPPPPQVCMVQFWSHLNQVDDKIKVSACCTTSEDLSVIHLCDY